MDLIAILATSSTIIKCQNHKPEKKKSKSKSHCVGFQENQILHLLHTLNNINQWATTLIFEKYGET